MTAATRDFVPVFDLDRVPSEISNSSRAVVWNLEERDGNLWQSTVEKDLAEITEHIKAAWEKRSSDQSYMKILRRAGAPKAS